jgi:hypothetical protein
METSVDPDPKLNRGLWVHHEPFFCYFPSLPIKLHDARLFRCGAPDPIHISGLPANSEGLSP